MNFLVDANLPPRLCSWLRDHGCQAAHLSDLQSLRLPDKDVWSLAVTRSEVVLTKDTDFSERSLLYGQPPQVVLAALGNCSNDHLLQLLGGSWNTIEAELTAGARLVVVKPARIEVFP